MLGEIKTGRMLNHWGRCSFSIRIEVIVVRYNHEIKFFNEGKRKYNPITSSYEGGSELVADVMGNVTDVGADRSAKLFGSIVQGVKVVRLVEPIEKVWAYLTIDDSPTKYRMRTTTIPLKNVSILVGEDIGKS